MVDYYGNWIYEKNTPTTKMCDMDYIARMIEANGYEPMTTMKNLVEMIILSYQGYLEDEEIEYYGIENDPENPMINVDDVECYVHDNGGFAEFDYYC